MENKNNRNIILGTVVVIVGTMLLLNNFELIGEPVKYYLLSWKTLLIAIGVAMMISKRHLIGGIFLSSLGIIFWLPTIFDHQIQLGHVFLPAMLVVAGIILLLKASGIHRRRNQKTEFTEYEELEISKPSTQDTE